MLGEWFPFKKFVVNLWTDIIEINFALVYLSSYELNVQLNVCK